MVIIWHNLGIYTMNIVHFVSFSSGVESSEVCVNRRKGSFCSVLMGIACDDVVLMI